MIERQLGRSGMTVSGLGLGCWAIGGPFWAGEQPLGWGEVDDAESVRAIRRGLELGVTFFDTADVYGVGHSEEVLGRALAGRREEVVIATKFGNTFDPHTRQLTGQDASPDYLRSACEASLRRLGSDYIDLYQFHVGDYNPTGATEVREGLEELVREGFIRAYAWSTDDPERARVFADGEHCTAVQHELNVFNDAGEMLSVCEALGLASINRGPLAMGLLTGKFTAASKLAQNDVRGKEPAWMRYFKDGSPTPEFLEKLGAVRDLLTSGGRTLTQGALGWIWARSGATVPIPGFRTVEQVEENAGALSFGPLSASVVREIGVVLGR